jgi:DivIVA domain-containing protein
MSYAPVELRHVRLPRGFFRGYRRKAVDVLLEEVTASFETVWRERGELADHLEVVEKQLEDLRAREQLLSTTLVSAQKAAAEAKERATHEVELILAEAHSEARSIMRAAQNERERLFAEVRRIETLMRTALGIVQEADRAELEPSELSETEQDERAEPWPRREDTREFSRASLVVATDQEAQAG